MIKSISEDGYNFTPDMFWYLLPDGLADFTFHDFFFLFFFLFSLNMFNAKAYGETISTHGLVRQSSRNKNNKATGTYIQSEIVKKQNLGATT